MRKTFVALVLGLINLVWIAIVCADESVPSAAPTPIAVRAPDLDSHVHGIGLSGARPTAVVFLGTECPISNRYVPVLNDLAKSADAQSVTLLVVISDPTVSRAAAKEYREKYSVAPPILLDSSGVLARALHPSATPEAFVIDGSGAVVYRGRIDDNYASVSRQKQQVEHHELADAIEAVAAGKPVAVRQTPAIGCVFEAWDKQPFPAASVTYARDVAPILMANCATCHRAGEVAPFALTSYADAAKRAKQIAAVTKRRFMPPWKAEAGYGHFADERRLTDDEIAILASWAEGGAPEGDASDLPPPANFGSGWKLGEPDLVLTMPQAFDVPAGGPDIYRAFVLPIENTDDKFVAGVQFVPGEPSVVHHSIFYLDNTGQGRKKQEAAASTGPGYESFGGIGFPPSGSLGGWAPGAMPYLLPDGTGRMLRKGSDVVMQIHYHPDGRPHSDQSKLAIYFCKKPVQHIVSFISLGTHDIDIPAGDANYVRTKSMILPADVTFDGITPHMHLVGREMEVTATEPDGRVVPLIWIKDWDFRWQDQYRYAEPFKLPKGTRIDLRAVYDNSTDNPANPNSPSKRVGWGEQTTDEMCVCFFSIRADSIAELIAIRQGLQSPEEAKKAAARAKEQDDGKAKAQVGATNDPAVQKDLAQLAGEWSMVSGEINGQVMPEAMRATARRISKDNETRVLVNDNLFMKARYTIDPSKTPKTIDYEMTGGPTDGQTQLGIYELDGDTVRFCFASGGGERPSEFSSPAGSNRVLSVWKLEKK